MVDDNTASVARVAAERALACNAFTRVYGQEFPSLAVFLRKGFGFPRDPDHGGYMAWLQWLDFDEATGGSLRHHLSITGHDVLCPNDSQEDEEAEGSNGSSEWEFERKEEEADKAAA